MLKWANVLKEVTRPAVETVFATAVISHSYLSQVTNSDINYLL